MHVGSLDRLWHTNWNRTITYHVSTLVYTGCDRLDIWLYFTVHNKLPLVLDPQFLHTSNYRTLFNKKVTVIVCNVFFFLPWIVYIHFLATKKWYSPGKPFSAFITIQYPVWSDHIQYQTTQHSYCMLINNKVMLIQHSFKSLKYSGRILSAVLTACSRWQNAH